MTSVTRNDIESLMHDVAAGRLLTRRQVAKKSTLVSDRGRIGPVHRSQHRRLATRRGVMCRSWWIAKLADLPGDITPHVLRHSFARLAADLGYNEPTIATLLGHKRSSPWHRIDRAVSRC